MKSYDFEYDGLNLSDKGFIICKFGSNGTETISNGSHITFNTVPTLRGAKHELTSTQYSDCLSTNFQICKHPCQTSDTEISVDEMRDIMRWLNRKEFHKFKLLNTEYINIFFEASFNVSRIENNGRLVGFELNVITNRPYALHEPIPITIKNMQENGEFKIYSQSDDEGYIYPEMEITINSDGNFEIFNSLENRAMKIMNCKAGEVITVDYPMIKSSLNEHRIQNDFNWQFFRIANSFRNSINKIEVSIPCTIKMKYSPVVKVGI
jgi:hypothetical protein